MPIDEPEVQVSSNRSRPLRQAGSPILPRHVSYEKGRDRNHVAFSMRVEEIARVSDQALVEPIRGLNEVGPVEEAARQCHAVSAHGVEFIAHDGSAVLRHISGPPL